MKQVPNSINIATVDSNGVENTMNLFNISITVSTDSLSIGKSIKQFHFNSVEFEKVFLTFVMISCF